LAFHQLTLSHLSHIFAGSHQDVVPAVLPFYHIYGMSILIVGRLAHGCKIVTLPKFEPKSFFKLLDQHQVLLVPSSISTACFSQQYKYLFVILTHLTELFMVTFSEFTQLLLCSP
jgi:acyl-CoA synthetase (AMP-forming)/AMP-acid ligase II